MLNLTESKRRVQMMDAIKDAENELGRVQHEYLRATGWTYTSDTPGCLWLWVKEAPKSRRKGRPEGAVMMLDTETALSMQRHSDDIELDERALDEATP